LNKFFPKYNDDKGPKNVNNSYKDITDVGPLNNKLLQKSRHHRHDSQPIKVHFKTRFPREYFKILPK